MTSGPSTSRRTGGLSDAGFAVLVAVVALLVAGAGIYYFGRQSGSHVTTPTSGPADTLAASPTRAGALGVVEQSYALSTGGQVVAACALESPAYLKFDAEHYLHESCEANVRAVLSMLASTGLTMHLDHSRITSFGHGRATVRTTVTLGDRTTQSNVYLRYHRGRWWITGGDDSHGDLGY